MDLSELLQYAVEYKASDLHLTTGRPPMVRTSWSTPSTVARSTCTASTFAPSASSSRFASASSGRSAAMTRSNPFCAQHLASSRPMPDEAPVTTARGRVDVFMSLRSR